MASTVRPSTRSSLETSPREVGPWLLKLHGDIQIPDTLVLTKAEYERLAEEGGALHGIVESLLLTSHVLFVGFSLVDHDFSHIADGVRKVRDRAVNLEDRPPAGTALTLHPGSVDEKAWLGEIDVVPVGAEDDLPAAARTLEVFLDRVAWAALRKSELAGEYLLDERYASGSTDADRALRRRAGAARCSGWFGGRWSLQDGRRPNGSCCRWGSTPVAESPDARLGCSPADREGAARPSAVEAWRRRPPARGTSPSRWRGAHSSPSLWVTPRTRATTSWPCRRARRTTAKSPRPGLVRWNQHASSSSRPTRASPSRTIPTIRIRPRHTRGPRTRTPRSSTSSRAGSTPTSCPSPTSSTTPPTDRRNLRACDEVLGFVIRARAVELLGPGAEPFRDYAMTEVVHCKSKNEVGVKKAAATCADRYLDRVVALSPAEVVVIVGSHAHDRLATDLDLPKRPVRPSTADRRA